MAANPGLPDDLVPRASGAISCAGLTYPVLETMLTARGMGHTTWSFVRIGDRLGPTPRLLDEVNHEIVREYANVPRACRQAPLARQEARDHLIPGASPALCAVPLL